MTTVKCTTCGRTIPSWVNVCVGGVWGRYCFKHAREAVQNQTRPPEIKHVTA